MEMVFKTWKIETMRSSPKTEAWDTSSFQGQGEETETIDEAEEEQPMRQEENRQSPGNPGSQAKNELQRGGEHCDKYINEGC